jgi:catechol 2,3-dioxygenase-like lactoylglutathione lyase family enzyme
MAVAADTRSRPLSIIANDYDLAMDFYTGPLRPLGLKLVYDSMDNNKDPSFGPWTLSYGPDERQELVDVFEYGDEAHAPCRGRRIAFNAPS